MSVNWKYQAWHLFCLLLFAGGLRMLIDSQEPFYRGIGLVMAWQGIVIFINNARASTPEAQRTGGAEA